MRPPSRPQSALRSPLNTLLGKEANVRVLRVLAEGDSPLSASEVARRAQLGLSGTLKSIAALTETGVVEAVAGGGRSPVRLRPGHPLVGALRELFRREREYFEHLVERLRGVAAGMDPLPQAVWIQGPAVSGNDWLNDSVVVGILAASGVLDRARDAFEAEVEPIEKELDVTIETRTRSVADLEATSASDLEDLREVIPLLGPPPLSLLSPETSRQPTADASRIRSHGDADARALALALAVAERLETDPSLVSRARAYVATRLTKASPGERRELREWDRLLRTMSLVRLRRFLVDPGERATRLRQTLPFMGALTAGERDQLVSRIGGGGVGE